MVYLSYMGKLSIYLPEDMDDRLRSLAEQRLLTVSTLVQKAVVEMLDGAPRKDLESRIETLEVQVGRLREIAERSYG